MIDIYSWNLIVDLGLLCLQAKKNYLSINIWLYHITHKEEKLLEKPKIYIKSIYIYFLHSHTTQQKKPNTRTNVSRATGQQKPKKNQLIPTTPSSTRNSSWRIMVLAINHFYLFYNEPLSFNLKGYFPNRELFVLPLERHLYYLHV
jgi:hypothetical protein